MRQMTACPWALSSSERRSTRRPCCVWQARWSRCCRGPIAGPPAWRPRPRARRPHERSREMTFIETIPEGAAEGELAELYAADRQLFGYLPHLPQAFSLRPAVYAAWKQLNGAVKSEMDLRRYELASLAAARRLRSSYCVLAHGSLVLSRKFL